MSTPASARPPLLSCPAMPPHTSSHPTRACMLAQGGEWEGVYEEIKAAELAILETLVDGRALEQHMEDCYLASLQQCVLAATATAASGGGAKKQ